MQVRKRFRFEAAHVLPYHTGKCARTHGHSYRLDVSVAGPLHTDGAERGMVIDFERLSAVVQTEIVDVLDHRSLNEVVDNPTAERVLAWIWRLLTPHLPTLTELTLWETEHACVILRAEDAQTRGELPG